MRRAQLANPELFPPKAMKRLIWPLMVEQLLAILIGMADTVMVSSAGEAAVSGVSLVDSLNVVLINLFSALATGGAVVTAQYIGRRDEKSARSSAKQLLYASAALSLLLAGIAILNIADRQIDIAWLAEGNKINSKLSDFQANIDRIVSEIGRASCRERV